MSANAFILEVSKFCLSMIPRQIYTNYRSRYLKEYISSAYGNMGKYLPKKGQVHENNECRKARVIFADISLLRELFPHINHKLIKQIIFYISSDYFFNKYHQN